MTEKILVETKNEFTEFLLHNLTPQLYEGFISMYKKSIELSAVYEDKIKKGANIQNLGVYGLFKIFLKDIDNLSREKIEREVVRIKNSSKYGDFFNDLIQAIIKSHILFFTYNNNKIEYNKYYEDIDINSFIHKCYIESAKIFYLNPEIFNDKNIDPQKNKENKHECFEIIKKSILNAIKLSIPMKSIIIDYVNNNNNKYKPLTMKHKLTNYNKKILDSSLSDNEKYPLPDVPDTSNVFTHPVKIIEINCEPNQKKEIFEEDNHPEPIASKEIFEKETSNQEQPEEHNKHEIIVHEQSVKEEKQENKEYEIIEEQVKEKENEEQQEMVNQIENKEQTESVKQVELNIEDLLEKNIKIIDNIIEVQHEKNSVKFEDDQMCKYVIKPPERKKRGRK